MKKLFVLLLSTLILVSLVSSCGSKSSIDPPDKLIVYQNGKVEEITKDSDVYQQTVKLILDRFPSKMDVAKFAILKEDISVMKNNELVLEFIYSSTQRNTFKLSGFKTADKQYLRLLFPLTGDHKELMFLGNDNSYFTGPLGPLSNSEKLVELLNK